MGATPEQRKSWEDDGVLTVPDAVVGNELERLREGFDRRADDAKQDWLRGVAAGTQPAAFFDIPNPMEKDSIFVDLADHPSYYPLLVDFSAGQVCMQFPQFRTVPPSPLSYVGWHFDVPFSNPLHMKVQLYLDDVGEDGGAFAYVPGSHLPENDPLPQVRHLEDMPGHRTFPGSAGTAILFNSWGMHTSMVNLTLKARKSIILIYEVFTEENYDPERYSFLADRLVTAEQRRLFGLERTPSNTRHG